MPLFLAFDTEIKSSSQEILNPVRAWLYLDEQGNTQQSGEKETLAEIAKKIPPASVSHIFIVSPDIVVMQVARPAGAFHKIRQAIPFLLEEQLAEDIEALHFSILNPQDPKTLSVAVINKALMKTCVDTLLAAGIVPQTILPLWLALPQPSEGQWYALLSPEYAWVHSGAFAGFTIERSGLKNLLETLPEKMLPKQLTWVGAENIEAELDECKKRHVHSKTVKIPSKAGKTWLEYAAKSFKSAASVNLLQGEFRINQQTGSEKRWRQIAKKLGIAVFAVWLTGLFGQYFFLRWEHYQLQHKIEMVYKEIFPNATVVANPRPIFERELAKAAAGKTGTDFLSLLLRTGEVISSFPQIQLVEIAYQDKTLSMGLMTDNFSRLQQLDEQLKNAGLTVEQENASSAGGTVNARWKVS